MMGHRDHGVLNFWQSSSSKGIDCPYRVIRIIRPALQAQRVYRLRNLSLCSSPNSSLKSRPHANSNPSPATKHIIIGHAIDPAHPTRPFPPMTSLPRMAVSHNIFINQ